jgi:quercetin dioxygenase-like cupin family protein
MAPDSRFFRLFSAPDGETHFEDIEPEPLDVTQIAFGKMAPGRFGDWHNERRRQFVITLAGLAEVTVSAGESRRLPPGTVMLVEDLTGKGHQTRVIGDEEYAFMFVALPE